MVIESPLIPNPEFAELAGDEQIQRTAQALEAIISMPWSQQTEQRPGAEVFLGASVTL